MNRISSQAFMAGMSLLLTGLAYSQDHQFVLEASPLKGAMGQVSARAESMLSQTTGLGIGVTDVREPGERSDMEDRRTSIHAEAVWYPGWLRDFRGVFVGAGLLYERATIGRQRERSYISRTSATSRYGNDKWANLNHYYSISQSVGYRYNLTKYFTVSFRLIVDEILFQESSSIKEEIYSSNVDTSAEDREPVGNQLSLQAGLQF